MLLPSNMTDSKHRTSSGSRIKLAQDTGNDITQMRPYAVAGQQTQDGPAEDLTVGRREVFKYLPRLCPPEQVLPGVSEEVMQIMTASDECAGEQVVEVGLVEEPDAGVIANQDTGGNQRVDLKPREAVEHRFWRKQASRCWFM